jgi:hypothetical protein
MRYIRGHGSGYSGIPPVRIETKDSTAGTKRKPNPSLGATFAMVTGGGTLPVMVSAVMGLPTLRLPATGLRSNQAFKPAMRRYGQCP